MTEPEAMSLLTWVAMSLLNFESFIPANKLHNLSLIIDRELLSRQVSYAPRVDGSDLGTRH